jgi:hypothetical protein
MARRVFTKPTDEVKQQFARMLPYDGDIYAALKQQQEFANSYSERLNHAIFGDGEDKKTDLTGFDAMKIVQGNYAREVVWPGDIITDIFTVQMVDSDTTAVEYPISPLIGEEDEYTAIVMPDEGAVPERIVTGDSAFVKPFDIGNSIYWKQSFTKQGNMAAINTKLSAFSAGFVQKINDIGWQTLLSAAKARAWKVSSATTTGIFGRELVTQLILQMRRRGGGNNASTKRFNMTDLYISPEAFEDILLWDTTDGLSDATAQQLWGKGFTDGIPLHGVILHVLDELGVGQRYEEFVEVTLGGTHTNSTLEYVLGLDMSKRDSFMMPVAEQISMIPDDSVLKRRLMGYYGFATLGAGCLDNRAVALGEF